MQSGQEGGGCKDLGGSCGSFRPQLCTLRGGAGKGGGGGGGAAHKDSWRRHAVRLKDCRRRGERAETHPWRRRAGWTGRWWLHEFGWIMRVIQTARVHIMRWDRGGGGGGGAQMDSWRRHAVRLKVYTTRGEVAEAHPWRRRAGWTGRWWLAAFDPPLAAIAGSPDGTRKPVDPTASPGELQLLTALLRPLHASSQLKEPGCCTSLMLLPQADQNTSFP